MRGLERLVKVAGAKGQAGLKGSGMLCRGIGLLAAWPIGRLIDR